MKKSPKIIVRDFDPKIDLPKFIVNERKALERCIDILSKGGTIDLSQLVGIAKATCDSYERGYIRAIKDINQKIIKINQ